MSFSGPSSGAPVAVGTQILAASNVAVTTNSLLVLPNNATFFWLEYNSNPIAPPNGVPEPTTFVLTGAAMLGRKR